MQSTNERCILSLNAGSSSIKFALYRIAAVPTPILQGRIERIGHDDARLRVHRQGAADAREVPVAAQDPAAAIGALADWLAAQGETGGLAAVGHRIVHGMEHQEPEVLTPALLQALRRIAVYDPEHLPAEIAMVERFGERFPALPQVACFDTAFHRHMPRVAQMLPIPRRFEARGLRRYGFHGLSYAYLMEELARVAGTPAAQGRVVLAHLGSGASMAAVQHGQGIDTSMGFSPTAGLPMGTRSGDLDPGVAAFLARAEQMGPEQFQHMVNHEAGLLGISETSADMRDLMARESHDVRAAEAVALFCYQARKCIGAYAAALGGLDTLVFAGGIGERSDAVRTRVVEGLDFLGLTLDPGRNAAHAPVISAEGSRVTVRVMRTDEEQMIARDVCRLLSLVA